MKFLTKAREKKDGKKGFTLVELIVVLVILTILMAILIPAMTGWITKAKEKTIAVNARTAYLGAQTLASEEFAKTTPNYGAAVTDDTVKALAEYPGEMTGVTVTEGKVTAITYVEGAYTASYNGTDWTITK